MPSHVEEHEGMLILNYTVGWASLGHSEPEGVD